MYVYINFIVIHDNSPYRCCPLSMSHCHIAFFSLKLCREIMLLRINRWEIVYSMDSIEREQRKIDIGRVQHNN